MMRLILGILIGLALCSVAFASAVFDENGDYFTIADTAALTFPDGDFSLFFWVKYDDNAGSIYQVILSWGAYAATPSIMMGMREEDYTDPNRIRIVAKDDDSTFLDSLPSSMHYETGWHHICYVRSGTTWTGYQDNVQFVQTAAANFDGIDVAEAMYIGRRSDSATFYLGGRLAEIGFISGTALSSAQRNSLLTQAPDNVITPTWYIPLYEDFTADAGGLSITTYGDVYIDADDHPIGDTDELVLLRRRRAGD